MGRGISLLVLLGGVMKIGIITHYYNSANYGGNLQAYALTRYLNKEYSAEQICYDRSLPSIKNRSKKYGPIKFVKKVIKRLTWDFKAKKYKFVNDIVSKRRGAQKQFNLSIPHSNRVYRAGDIDKVNGYDFYITGSDQVWHPSAICPAYLLNFAPENKKGSYAASIAVEDIPQDKKQLIKEALLGYKGVSLREKEGVDIVKGLTDKKVEKVLDPVFLLDKEEWQEIIDQPITEEKYIFCYFLGDGKKERKIAREYAKSKGLKILSMPYLTGVYRRCDKNFADEDLIEVSPTKFLSLIASAECVFTDSFHASAFSCIFNTPFFAFKRSDINQGGSRINSLCEYFNVEKRICFSKERLSLKYIESVVLDITAATSLAVAIDNSKDYLKGLIED